MSMRIRHFDHLRSFCIVAACDSFTRAADRLNLTKGAVSHQIDRLEAELGFSLFVRRKRGIELTENGRRLLRVAEVAFASIEQEAMHLRRLQKVNITIGMSTYFASRWLSPRLMHFITDHEDMGLRIQPVIGNPELRASQLDMAIRWGKGGWHDSAMRVDKIFACPAQLACSAEFGERIESEGIEPLLSQLNLLHDADGSRAWADWFAAAGLDMPSRDEGLVIPDPNVRVQAVIDGQGIALYDDLVREEIDKGRLYLYGEVSLGDYGYYLVYPRNAAPDSPIHVFRDWIFNEAQQYLAGAEASL